MSLFEAKATYEKKSGVLSLTPAMLLWGPQATTPVLRVSRKNVAGLACSKPDNPKARMKVTLGDNGASHSFLFTASVPVDKQDLERFRTELTRDLTTRQHEKEMLEKTGNGTLNSLAPNLAPPTTNAPSGASSRSSSVPPNKSATDIDLRRKVLSKLPELAILHQELVVGRQVTETEFWDGREHLLAAEAAVSQQRRGKASKIVDPRPSASEDGELKISLSPQMITDIFEEFPIVRKAYDEIVPKQLKEGEFWRRYFQSKLFNRHRASARTNVAKPDVIFDQYLEKEDDEIEPLHARQERVGLILDLAATAEDHGETGNKRDFTMQAGGKRGTLPLIRRFNEHSEKLLHLALGEPNPKRRRLDESQSVLSSAPEMYIDIDIEDLHNPETSTGIALEMQDRQRYFEGQATAQDQDGHERITDFSGVAAELKSSLEHWTTDLGGLRIDKRAGDESLQRMSVGVIARLESRHKRNDIPQNILEQMATCHTATNEFLRQFYSAIYPPSQDHPMSSATPAQKAAKATKMAGYISRTPDKIASIVQTAQDHGINVAQIEAAFAPLLTAIDRAMQVFQAKHSQMNGPSGR